MYMLIPVLIPVLITMLISYLSRFVNLQKLVLFIGLLELCCRR